MQQYQKKNIHSLVEMLVKTLVCFKPNRLGTAGDVGAKTVKIQYLASRAERS